MDTDEILRLLYSLGYNVEALESRTQAMTKLSEAIVQVDPGEEIEE